MLHTNFVFENLVRKLERKTVYNNIQHLCNSGPHISSKRRTPKNACAQAPTRKIELMKTILRCDPVYRKFS